MHDFIVICQHLPWVEAERVRFARSQAVRRRRTALFELEMSFLCLRLNSWMKWLTIRLSKSSPPKWVSPAVDLTSKIPSSIERQETSKVPPPKSKIKTLRSAPTFLSRPYAMAAAVGSLMIRRTLMPAIAPASFVAWRWMNYWLLKREFSWNNVFFTGISCWFSSNKLTQTPAIHSF